MAAKTYPDARERKHQFYVALHDRQSELRKYFRAAYAARHVRDGRDNTKYWLTELRTVNAMLKGSFTEMYQGLTDC